jgi:hypothetical protein
MIKLKRAALFLYYLLLGRIATKNNIIFKFPQELSQLHFEFNSSKKTKPMVMAYLINVEKVTKIKGLYNASPRFFSVGFDVYVVVKRDNLAINNFKKLLILG